MKLPRMVLEDTATFIRSAPVALAWFRQVPFPTPERMPLGPSEYSAPHRRSSVFARRGGAHQPTETGIGCGVNTRALFRCSSLGYDDVFDVNNGQSRMCSSNTSSICVVAYCRSKNRVP